MCPRANGCGTERTNVLVWYIGRLLNCCMTRPAFRPVPVVEVVQFYAEGSQRLRTPTSRFTKEQTEGFTIQTKDTLLLNLCGAT
jgi:hypothetical protein